MKPNEIKEAIRKMDREQGNYRSTCAPRAWAKRSLLLKNMRWEFARVFNLLTESGVRFFVYEDIHEHVTIEHHLVDFYLPDQNIAIKIVKGKGKKFQCNKFFEMHRTIAAPVLWRSETEPLEFLVEKIVNTISAQAGDIRRTRNRGRIVMKYGRGRVDERGTPLKRRRIGPLGDMPIFPKKVGGPVPKLPQARPSTPQEAMASSPRSFANRPAPQRPAWEKDPVPGTCPCDKEGDVPVPAEEVNAENAVPARKKRPRIGQGACAPIYEKTGGRNGNR